MDKVDFFLLSPHVPYVVPLTDRVEKIKDEMYFIQPFCYDSTSACWLHTSKGKFSDIFVINSIKKVNVMN